MKKRIAIFGASGYAGGELIRLVDAPQDVEREKLFDEPISLPIQILALSDSPAGSDVGAEKFFNLKCQASGMSPDVAVIVATVRALKLNSGKFDVRAGRPLPDDMVAENPDELVVYGGRGRAAGSHAEKERRRGRCLGGGARRQRV